MLFFSFFFRGLKNLLMPLFLMGCFPVDFQEGKRPLRMKSGKRPIKVGKRPIKEGKRPIKTMVLVGISVDGLMGCFRAPPPCWKTAPLKRPIKRSMRAAGRCLGILHVFFVILSCFRDSGGVLLEEDKRATTNVQNRFVQFFLLSLLIFYYP